eukprot:s175_g9.t1
MDPGRCNPWGTQLMSSTKRGWSAEGWDHCGPLLVFRTECSDFTQQDFASVRKYIDLYHDKFFDVAEEKGEAAATRKGFSTPQTWKAKPSEEPAKAAKEEAPRKKPLKQPKRKAQKAEEPSAKPAKTAKTKSSKGSKSSTAADGDGGLHPSWNAKKAAKVSGALVQAAGDRKVFDSDSDA